MTTPYHAKYFAHELTRQAQPGGVDRLSMALFDACVDLNPHQIEAAMFALRSPLSKGVVLADEVGLGKTIEAGLVLCQHWAERKRKLLVICPASLRKQWALELQEKFNMSTVILDSKTYKQAVREGNGTPFASNKVVITSFHFASRFRGDIRAVPFDLVVIDEAHKLRNAYRPSNKMGQNIKWAIEDRKKCLLTATPLQNSLLELYGLSTILDDLIFGDVNSFRTQYTNAGADLNALRGRLQSFCKRTLRRQVVEYIQYTERIPFTVRFRPTDEEQKLYEAVSDFLNREETYSVPHRQRHLTALILRKLLASSSHAIASTLETMKSRLEDMRDTPKSEDDDEEFMEELIEAEELEDDYLDEILEGTTDREEEDDDQIDLPKLNEEITELTRYSQWARSIGIDTKSRSLKQALELGFAEMDKMGANRKALIFTESRRTQDYLKNFLESNGYGGQIVLFNGTNADPDSRQIITKWIEDNADSGRVTGSRPVDSRTALIEHFQNEATVMIATEAAAEGVNMQFCSLVINYDLPWNPQRIEQRIGRCHRYGQKHDVVVINFLNERNEADRRVHELLAEKFNLFNGVFGASDEVLGQIESGVDFEKRILAIYEKCRTTDEIDAAFKQLQEEMDETIQSKMDETRQMLMEHFDEDVHARLKMRLDDARANLDRIGRQFWTLTKVVLDGHASFCDDTLTFELREAPLSTCRPGTYHLISKTRQNVPGDFLYRLSHPLGEWSIDQGKQAETPVAKVTFDVTNYPMRVSVVEALKGKSGWLTLQYLTIDSFDREEYLLFSAMDETGKSLDQETCQKLFHCAAQVADSSDLPPELTDRLKKEAGRHAEATITHSLEGNNALFNEERERLEKWAEDMVVAVEKDLADTKAQIKAVRRQSRLATTLDEQNDLQQKLRDLEKKQRKQRQQIFEVEDEIAEKRDDLIDGLQQRMTQKTHSTHLFTIQWEVA
ncbi:ATP-dependent helicase [Bremerella cremea]|uniref:ATP-dependent helicase n=1 Tax=Bremerella cremea TaxID=1031537 RepID=A0A368KSF8_9BACT|nr:SNF2-related protein [Bremerella cremea]RCS47654.1 ATP-dependent helicase [Bremerella cremea]